MHLLYLGSHDGPDDIEKRVSPWDAFGSGMSGLFQSSKSCARCGTAEDKRLCYLFLLHRSETENIYICLLSKHRQL